MNIKISSSQYRKSHCGDKMILRPSYLHVGISYTGKMISLYWIGALFHVFDSRSRQIVRNLEAPAACLSAWYCWWVWLQWLFVCLSAALVCIGCKANIPDSKVHRANMGPIWGRQDPDGPSVGPMNLAIWAAACLSAWYCWWIWLQWLFFCLSAALVCIGSNANIPDSKVHGGNMGPIWGRQDPDGPSVGPMNLAIWAAACLSAWYCWWIWLQWLFACLSAAVVCIGFNANILHIHICYCLISCVHWKFYWR